MLTPRGFLGAYFKQALVLTPRFSIFNFLFFNFNVHCFSLSYIHFWRCVISIKYGMDWGDVQQRWCEVLIAWVFGRVLEKDGIPFGMTNGVDCGDSCLKYLFTLALDKNASMASYLVGMGNRLRQVQDWETELVENLFDLLYSNFPSTQGENRLPWTLRKNGKCDVKSYDELRSSRNIPFFGKAFGVLGCLVRSLFSLGHQSYVRFWLLVIFGSVIWWFGLVLFW